MPRLLKHAVRSSMYPVLHRDDLKSLVAAQSASEDDKKKKKGPTVDSVWGQLVEAGVVEGATGKLIRMDEISATSSGLLSGCDKIPEVMKKKILCLLKDCVRRGATVLQFK